MEFFVIATFGPKGKIQTGYVVRNVDGETVATFKNRECGGLWRTAKNWAEREAERLNGEARRMATRQIADAVARVDAILTHTEG